MHGVLEAGFLVVAGVVAGVIGTAGGITSLVAYPALLAVGIAPLAANVTSSVALIGSGLSSALRAGPDVEGRGPTFRRWLPGIMAGSLAGGVLLVATPSGVFDHVVPFLVAAGSVVVLAQPAIERRRVRTGREPPRGVIVGCGAAVAVYNGYFGAGAGILMIALLLVATEPVLHRANALKNVILVSSDVLPAVLFAVAGSVVWRAVWPLGLGAVGGGLIGPSLARRVPARVLRPLVGLCGFALAGYLLVTG